MSQRVFPLIDVRHRPSVPLANPLAPWREGERVFDQRSRPLKELRISVTDRCNFRCTYCMPKEIFDNQYKYLAHKELLSFEEITRLCKSFLALGVEKIRLTGGEPLLRKNIEVLISQLRELQTRSGAPLDLTLTTNGSLLKQKAAALKRAGLDRITISLDAMQDSIFKAMNDVDFSLSNVLEGITAAKEVGLGLDDRGMFSGMKINMVVKRGTNDSEILPMTRYFHGQGVSLRFIEYMDVGTTNGWNMTEVLPSEQVISLIQNEFELVKLPPKGPGETAVRYGFKNSSGHLDASLGEIGLISSVTQAFCDGCNRARLSTEGQLFLCLFASEGHDLRAALRGGASEHELTQTIANIWSHRDDRYSQLRSLQSKGQQSTSVNADPQASISNKRKVEMSYIGG
jgi:cyclic pyranopterin phosphate synthase